MPVWPLPFHAGLRVRLLVEAVAAVALACAVGCSGDTIDGNFDYGHGFGGLRGTAATSSSSSTAVSASTGSTATVGVDSGQTSSSGTPNRGSDAGVSAGNLGAAGSGANTGGGITAVGSSSTGIGAGGASSTAAAAGTGGTLGVDNGDAGAITATFSQVATYVAGSCATSTACHGRGAREVVLSPDTLYETLMTLTVTECNGEVMVVPYDPTTSALYNMLNGGCGSFRMPPACARVPCTGAANLQLVEAWISAGAPSE